MAGLLGMIHALYSGARCMHLLVVPTRFVTHVSEHASAVHICSV